MDQVTCIVATTFETSLTRGKIYEVLSANTDKSELRIIDDTNTQNWFPNYCFSDGVVDIMKVKHYEITDDIQFPYLGTVEVTLTVTVGEDLTKRWCYFLTPAYMYKTFAGLHPEPGIFGAHGIVIPLLNRENIEAAIIYLENENLVEKCTLPMEP